MTIPCEFDAELAAFKTVKKVFGAEEAEAILINGEDKHSRGKILSYDFNKPYDVLDETIGLLKKYYNQLHIYIQTAEDPDIKTFDIDGIIRELKTLKQTLCPRN